MLEAVWISLRFASGLISSTRPPGRRIIVCSGRGSLWVILALTLTGMVIYSLATHSKWIEPDLPEVEQTILSQAGISPVAYGVYLATMELIVALAFGAASLVIFRSKRDDGIALLVSFALITFGATVFPFISSADLQWVVRPIQIFGIAAAALTIFLFPNGRFVPSWTRQLAFGLGIWLTALLVFPEITGALGDVDDLAPVQTGLRFIAWLFGTDISADFTTQMVNSCARSACFPCCSAGSEPARLRRCTGTRMPPTGRKNSRPNWWC